MVETVYRMSRRGEIPGLPEITGWARPTIYLAIKEGRFPVGTKISPKVRIWTESEIDAWLEERTQEGK